MSDTPIPDFGIFPPGEVVEIDGFGFLREEFSDRLGRVEIWDQSEDENEPIGCLPRGFKTEDAALAWLAGYSRGHAVGERRGRRALQSEFRELLGVD